MAEAAACKTHIPEQISELRLLTEVHHLRRNLRPDGSIDPEILDDIRLNLFTATEEMAIPSAVTHSVQRVETEGDESGRSRRTIKWLGKSAVEVAMSGYQFHVS